MRGLKDEKQVIEYESDGGMLDLGTDQRLFGAQSAVSTVSSLSITGRCGAQGPVQQTRGVVLAQFDVCLTAAPNLLIG